MFVIGTGQLLTIHYSLLNNMSKNVSNSSRTDFDGKDTTTGTLKARKKFGKFFLSSSTLVCQQVTTFKKKDDKNTFHFCLSANYGKS